MPIFTLLFALLFTISASLFAQEQRPKSGLYRVVHDSSQIETPVWDVLCSDKPETVLLSENDKVKLHHYDKNKWWIDGAKKLRIGSHLCYAKNPSTKVQSSQFIDQKWMTYCEANFASQGKEKEHHEVKTKGRNLEITIVYEHDLLKPSAHCKYIEKRLISLKRIKKRKKRVGTETLTMTDIKQELETDAIDAISNIPQGDIQITVENHLKDEFIPQKMTYFIDGNEILNSKKQAFEVLKTKQQIQLLKGLQNEGVHTIELQTQFRVKDAGEFFTIRLKKQFIYELKRMDRKKLTVQIYMDDKIFEDKPKRIHIQLLIDGKIIKDS